MGNLSRMEPEEQKGKDVADVSRASLLWSTVSRVVAIIVKVKTDVERNAADCQLPFFFFFSAITTSQTWKKQLLAFSFILILALYLWFSTPNLFFIFKNFHLGLKALFHRRNSNNAQSGANIYKSRLQWSFQTLTNQHARKPSQKAQCFPKPNQTVAGHIF